MSGNVSLAFLTGNAGGGELLLIFIVALVLFGAKRLPDLARSLGRALEEFRRAARDVTDELRRGAEEPPPAPPPPPPEKDRDHDPAG
ncbi:MAG: twin-arginine translocase TatA/TatE family subunit [Kiritimatiellae bacterium]|nr:twin-arginine translocase TatA/TatE family subunit [Kiritimatiellia bacterium]